MCRENKRVLKTQICVTRPQCVKAILHSYTVGRWLWFWIGMFSYTIINAHLYLLGTQSKYLTATLQKGARPFVGKQMKYFHGIFFFHIHTVHLDIIKVFFIHQLMHKWTVLNTILKFTLKLTLKLLLHVSLHSPSSGSALFELAKVTVVKIIN